MEIWGENKEVFWNQVHHWMENGNSKVLNRILNLLLIEDHWTENPETFRKILKILGKDAYSALLGILTHSDHLIQHPEIMEELIEISAKTLDYRGLTLYLKESQWTAHPRFLQQLLRQGRAGALAVSDVLAAPEWGDHPEILQELIQHAKEWNLEKEVRYLLKLDHWKNNPLFKKSHCARFLQWLGSVRKTLLKTK